MPPGEPTPIDLPEQLLASAARVRLALARGLDLVAPPPRRPTDVQRALGIDKSLASRLHRASLSDEPIETVLDGAGVQGLRQALDRLEACTLHDATQPPTQDQHATLHELREAVQAFASICDAFPDGRIGLETVMADQMPEVRKVAERKARRAVFQAHTFLMGFSQEVAYRAFIRVPTKGSPNHIDLIYVDLCIGMVKLRKGITAYYNGVSNVSTGESAQATLTTVEGRTEPIEPMAFILPDRCNIEMSRVDIRKRGPVTVFAMPSQHPVLAPPVNIGLTHGIRCAAHRFARPEMPFERHFVIMRKPVRTLVWDEFCDPAIGSGPPEVTASFASGPGDLPLTPELDAIYPLHQPEGFESLGVGVSRLMSSDVPDCPGLIASVLARAGIDASRLSAHRLRIEYPVPHTRYIVWHRLMDAPKP
ncbi:MAG: hypothetical protein K2W85_12775 [Phycisphaerales bacterium]|nr:hypothetical protein [Phycisphaerales bacterium]